MTVAIILLAVVCLACANGANDNFKGVATLFGSGTTNYRGALAWATVATLLGSLTAVFLAGRILGIEAASLLDRLHFLSAGIVSYCRSFA